MAYMIETSILVDDTVVGWHVWPTSYTAYKVNTHESLFETIEPDSVEAYTTFGEAFTSPEYWDKMSKYLSEEAHQKTEDCFNDSHARLFSSIFQMYQDLPLEAARPCIENLCASSDQKNAQRAASEILGGLVRGTKHWNPSKLARLWEWLLPLLQRAFLSITPDSLTYWESFVKFCVARRDPRRIRPLIDLLLSSELDPTSDAAFNEARKLLLIRAMVVKLQWRGLPLVDRLLPTHLNNLQHPYKQVREVIGGNIYEFLQLEWVPGVSSVDSLLRMHAKTGDGVGHVAAELNAEQQTRVTYIIQRLDQWFKEIDGNTASSDYAHASKTGKDD